MIVMQRIRIDTPQKNLRSAKWHIPRASGAYDDPGVRTICNFDYKLDVSTATESTQLTTYEMCISCLKVLHRRKEL